MIFITVMYTRSDLHLKNENNLKTCDNSSFFNTESIFSTNQLYETQLKYNLQLSVLSKLNFVNHESFFKYLLLLSGDINLNPGPKHSVEIANDTWQPFKRRGLHLLHININSLLPKIDELSSIAKETNAAIIGVTESKLDDSILNEEIKIEGYDLLRCDRNRHGGGVACYIKQNICYKKKNIFDNQLENIIFDILLPKIKPFTVGIFYRPPNQNDFLKIMSNKLDTIRSEHKEIYILGDFNINLYFNNSYVFNKKHNISHIQMPPMVKQYKELCSTSGLKQIINVPTCITCYTSTLIDHILTNSSSNISQSGLIDTGISDHQMIYCTRKITRSKSNAHRLVKYRSFKNYTPELFKEKLEETEFPNYVNFCNVDDAYSDFMKRLSCVVDNVAPTKESRIKHNTQEWFDGEIAESIAIRDKLFKKYKNSKLHVDKEIYVQSRNQVRNLIKFKNKGFLKKN